MPRNTYSQRVFSTLAITLALTIALPALQALAPHTMPPAFANNPASRTLESFFQSFQGSWRGQGIAVENSSESPGTVATTLRYTTSSTVRYQHDGTWIQETQVTTESGSTQNTQQGFGIQDQTLYLWFTQFWPVVLLPSYVSGYVPVSVLASSPTKLTYRIDRADVITGQVFQHSFDAEFRDTNHFLGHNTVSSNGVLISEDRYELTRW